MKKKINKVILLIAVFFTVFGVSTVFAAYPTEIKTASRPGLVSQSGYDPISGGWSDVSATTVDDTSNKRLFYSNDPELIPYVNGTFYGEGIIFNSAFRSDGGRFFMHHYNNSLTLDVKVAILARNVGSSSGSITIGRYGDGNGANLYNPLDVGGTAVKQFFSNSPLNQTFSSIPVNGWVTLAQKTIGVNQTVDLNMDLSFNGTFRLYVAYVTSSSSYSSPLSFVQANYNYASSYPPSQSGGVSRGDSLYARTINVNFNPDNLQNARLRVNCCAPSQTHPNDTIVTAYDYTWNTSSPLTRQIVGNFGLLYHFNVNTGTWATNSSTKQLFAGLNPRGGSFLGGAWATADIPGVTGGVAIPQLSGNSETGILGRWGSYWRTANIDYILPGGANAPNVVVFTGFTP
ncbi:hypothetical protein [Paenibacillus sp. HB172176]|uniref:hypothetical protein n=1 Tax=Paenibacillus sp. HB172176 TaxID=2493690 RepID=UPI00143B89AD|nr:hypothetical protein [Paenibacillus sp. HB172176]